MIITKIIDLCCGSNICFGSKGLRKGITLTLDGSIALALLVIGSMALSGHIHMSHHIAYAFVGGGVVYTTLMLLTACKKIKWACQ